MPYLFAQVTKEGRAAQHVGLSAGKTALRPINVGDEM
jgi:hypothetical protein